MVDAASKDKVLDRIRKFINLAASPNLKEAQNAAMQACALIRENGLDVVDPDKIDALYVRESDLQAKVKELEAAKLEVAKDTEWLPLTSGSMYHRTSTCQPVGYYVGRPVTTARPPMTAPVLLRKSKGGVKYDGNKCLQCSKVLPVGEEALWQDKVGMWCPNTNCYQDWLVAQNAVGSFNPLTP